MEVLDKAIIYLGQICAPNFVLEKPKLVKWNFITLYISYIDALLYNFINPEDHTLTKYHQLNQKALLERFMFQLLQIAQVAAGTG